MPSRRSDQGFDLADERAIVHGAVERTATFALDERRQVRCALAAALADEDDVDAVTARHVAVNALDALHPARRVGIAENQRRPLHRDAADEQAEWNVDDLIAARSQRRDQSLGFRGSVAHEDQGASFGRAP